MHRHFQAFIVTHSACFLTTERRSVKGKGGRLHSLARKDHSVWKTRSLPSVRPIAIGHVKSGFSAGIMERLIEAERARRLVQFQQINARLYTCDHQPLRLFVPTGPVREESIVYRKP